VFFDDLCFVYFVVLHLVLCTVSLGLLIVIFLPALISICSVLAKRWAGKSVSDMTCLVSSGTLNLNLIHLVFGLPTVCQCKPKGCTC